MSSKPALRLDWATHRAAAYAVEHWHYSQTMPVGKSVKIGAWEDGRFIGALIFTWGANHHLAASIGVEMTQCAELVRVALRKHAASVTRILAIACKMLRKQSPGLRVLVSYADPNKGHHGGIYQGAGWLYLGTTNATYVYVLDGIELHKRAFTGAQFGGGAASRAPVPRGAEKVMLLPKHKYVLPLTEADRVRLQRSAKPYPKRVRAGGAESGTSAHHAEGDGAVPIPALQTSQ